MNENTRITNIETDSALRVIEAKHKNILTAVISTFTSLLSADCYSQRGYDMYINAIHTLGKETNLDEYPMVVLEDYTFENVTCTVEENMKAILHMLVDIFNNFYPNQKQCTLAIYLHRKDAWRFGEYLRGSDFSIYADFICANIDGVCLHGKKDDVGIYTEDWVAFHFICER